ncbi:GNAT family N-acetyltransferase [Bacillus suaedaesalsae]|uniref:GNAT family N-acetyltransferase n=1 Tax=Bacillus suaedaesalsae TaxID=2810349 RepID=A0ABS2DG75_9BACI|nr:GNAT family N-acetyltransferase [Bacillus suaedaesalsae]MBM6616543.1 GNAT family N-acetyltransferase [Bacillus suaedaesalsae]
MIRKLTEKDHELIWSFLSNESSMNLFILGDIEAFGYDKDFQELWGEFDELNQLKAVLLRFHQSWIPYANGVFDVDGFISIIKEHTGDDQIMLSGKEEIVRALEERNVLNLGRKQVTYFAECKTTENLSSYDDKKLVKKATIEDVDRIIDIRSSIAEFNLLPSAREILIQSMKSNVGRTYYTEDNSIITASASTTAEYSKAAMIVGVCTRKEYRRRGLASNVMEVLFREVLDEGKTLCLFYDNPEAGSIYKRLGFVDIGKWIMYR